MNGMHAMFSNRRKLFAVVMAQAPTGCATADNKADGQLAQEIPERAGAKPCPQKF
jgi:hypothetical protein